MGSSTKSRLSNTVQIQTSGGVITGTITVQPSSPVPLQKQVFTASSLKTPDDVARQLNTMQAQLHEATLPSRTSLRNQATTFEGLVFNGTDPHPPIQHNYGGKVRWNVVNWYATTTHAGVFEVSQDAVALTLNSTTAGTADVEVWSAG